MATAQRHQGPKPLTTGQITVLMRKRKQALCGGQQDVVSRGLGAWFTEIGFRSEQMGILLEISGIYLIDTVEDLVYLHANVSAGVRKVFAYPGLFDKIEAALTQEAEDNAAANSSTGASAGGAISGGLRPEGVCKPAALTIAGTRGKSDSESESKRGRSGVRGAQAAYAARAEITSGSVTAAGAGAAEGGALSGAGTGAAAATATAAAATAAVAAAAGDQCGPPSPTRRAW